MKCTALGVGIGTALAISAAQAEPLTLSVDQLDQVTAAGYAFVDGTLNVRINEDINKRVWIDKFIKKFQFVDVEGYFAEANGAANCFGSYGCQATSYGIADVHHGEGYATSVSGAEAVTDGFSYVYSTDPPPYDPNDNNGGNHP